MEVGAKKLGLFDYINSITKKTYLGDQLDSGYSQFMVNRFLSSDNNLVFVMNELNKGNLTNKMHYDLLYYAIPKTGKFFKYNMKKEAAEKHLKYVCDYYKVNQRVGSFYLEYIDKEELTSIVEYFENRGLMKGKK